MPSAPRPTVHIVSDGLPETTFIQGPDGTVIPDIVSSTWELEVGTLARVTLTIVLPHLDVDAEVHQITYECRCCGANITHTCEPNSPSP